MINDRIISHTDPGTRAKRYLKDAKRRSSPGPNGEKYDETWTHDVDNAKRFHENEATGLSPDLASPEGGGHFDIEHVAEEGSARGRK